MTSPLSDEQFAVLEQHLTSLKSPSNSAMHAEAEALRVLLTHYRTGCVVCANRLPR